MSFYADPAFFVFLAVALIPSVILGVLGKPIQKYGLVVSVVFLGLLFFRDLYGACSFALFLVISLGAMFLVNRWFQKESPHAVAYYRIALFVVLVPLICAKVSGAFNTNVLGFVGISYLTFKSVQVLIEIRDGLIKNPSFFDLLYFLLFFPVFTSGPIMRSRNFSEQLSEGLTRQEYAELLSQGILWFIKGVMYTFVLSSFVQWLMWFAPSALGDATTAAFVGGQLIYGLAYGLHMFFDFAGYSLLAMGVGSCLGIRVPQNFNAPFRSIDIKDFWNRWHMTLSFWLRDYVFMRVTKASLRRKWFKSRVTTACVSYLAMFFLMGVWHGLNLDCVLYGIYHGILLCACEIFQKKSKFYKNHRKKTWYKVGSWAITMIAVFFGFAIIGGQVALLVLGA